MAPNKDGKYILCPKKGNPRKTYQYMPAMSLPGGLQGLSETYSTRITIFVGISLSKGNIMAEKLDHSLLLIGDPNAYAKFVCQYRCL